MTDQQDQQAHQDQQGTGAATATCDQCGGDFVPDTGQQRFCCGACSDEHRADKPRPPAERVDILLWLFYIYQDHPIEYSYRRQRAVYGREACLTEAEVREVVATFSDGKGRRPCAQCGRSYFPDSDSAGEGADSDYCCGPCRDEAGKSRRTWTYADTPALLRRLYKTEDRSAAETYHRQRAILGVDDCLTYQQTRTLLEGMGIFHDTITARQKLLDADPSDILGDDHGPGQPQDQGQGQAQGDTGDDTWEDYYLRGDRSDPASAESGGDD